MSRVEFTVHLIYAKGATCFEREEQLPFAPFIGLDVLDNILGEFKLRDVAWDSGSHPKFPVISASSPQCGELTPEDFQPLPGHRRRVSRRRCRIAGPDYSTPDRPAGALEATLSFHPAGVSSAVAA